MYVSTLDSAREPGLALLERLASRRQRMSSMCIPFRLLFRYVAKHEAIVNAAMDPECGSFRSQTFRHIIHVQVLHAQRNSSNWKHGLVCEDLTAHHHPMRPVQVGPRHVDSCRGVFFMSSMTNLPAISVLSAPHTLHR